MMEKKSCSTCKHFSSLTSTCEWMHNYYGQLPEWVWYKSHVVSQNNGEFCYTWEKKVDEFMK